jgi:putative nucleotidyltransferase with HDIG domain
MVAAEECARTLLTVLPRRLTHVASVAHRAGEVARALRLDADLVVSSAWLHDIGYAPTAAATGFHPLDGARFLRDQGVDERVVNLVAHHSHAIVEAEERGADRELLAEFPLDPSLPHDALCFCDMTTGPDGQQMVVRHRLAEIRERYGPHDLVTRFITRAEPLIVETVERVESQLVAAAQSR